MSFMAAGVEPYRDGGLDVDVIRRFAFRALHAPAFADTGAELIAIHSPNFGAVGVHGGLAFECYKGRYHTLKQNRKKMVFMESQEWGAGGSERRAV
jgi:hypothetical protein